MLNNLAKIDNGTYYSVVVNISSNSGKSAYILYSLNSSENTHFKSSYGWNSIGYAGRIKAYTVLQENEGIEQKVDISSVQHSNVSPISFTEPAMDAVEIADSKKARSSILVTPSGTSRCPSIFQQSENAPAEIVRTPLGIVRLPENVQLENASLPIYVKFFGRMSSPDTL